MRWLRKLFSFWLFLLNKHRELVNCFSVCDFWRSHWLWHWNLLSLVYFGFNHVLGGKDSLVNHGVFDLLNVFHHIWRLNLFHFILHHHLRLRHWSHVRVLELHLRHHLSWELVHLIHHHLLLLVVLWHLAVKWLVLVHILIWALRNLLSPRGHLYFHIILRTRLVLFLILFFKFKRNHFFRQV